MDCGQLICSECSKKVKECPICYGPKEKICRNLALKKVINGLTVMSKKEAAVQVKFHEKEIGVLAKTDKFDKSPESRAKD